MNVTPQRLVHLSAAPVQGERGSQRLDAVHALWTRTRGFRWLWVTSLVVPLLAFTGAAGLS